MKKERKPESFIKGVAFEGGPKALRSFILENMQYPDEAKVKGIKGVVRLRLFINEQGIVLQSKVISGIGYGCDQEAQRLVSLLKFKTDPPKGTKITYQKVLNIPFAPPKPNLPKAQPTGFSYSIKEKKPLHSADKVQPNTSKIISYSIKLGSQPK